LFSGVIGYRCNRSIFSHIVLYYYYIQMDNDIILKKFWRLTIIEYAWSKWRYRMVKCICDCWNVVIKAITLIKQSKIRSCWCLKKEWNNLRHWMVWTQFYKKWENMYSRCNNKKRGDYYWKWITRKRVSFNDFYNDMYDSYKLHVGVHWKNDTTIDRIDNNWDYCRSNCKRSTIIEQANNKTNSHFISYKDRKQTLAQRCKELSLNYKKVERRINKLSWDIDRAFDYK